MKIHSSFVLAPVVLALLSACGGGGDTSGSSGGGGSGPQAVAVSTTNQTSVARASVTGGLSVTQTQTGGNTAQSSSMSVNALVQRALVAMGDPRVHAASAGAHPESTNTVTLSCGTGGTISTTFADNDNNLTLSSGDVFTLVFSQCQDSPTESLNGTIVITATSVTSSSQFSASASLQSVQAVDGALSSTVNGTVTVAELDSTSESDTTINVGASGLSVITVSPTYSDAITFASGMQILSKDQFTLAQTVTTLDGSYSATSIGGTVTVATTQPVVTRYTDDFPYAGTIHITGANNSALLITVLDNTQVQLQVDANGDGTYESSSAVGWETLLPL
jgi:hypothetical protein